MYSLEKAWGTVVGRTGGGEELDEDGMKKKCC
jgi:hypothetical protein